MDRRDYENDICARSGAAIDVRYEPGASIGQWQPKVGDCHANVDYWVSHRDGYTAVRGWLAYADFGLGMHGYTAHSVLRSPDGELVDITPVEDRNFVRRRFIVHIGDEETFLRMRTLDLNISCQGNCPTPELDLSWIHPPSSTFDDGL